MPATVSLDSNLHRTFVIHHNRNNSSEAEQTVTLNVRAVNLLNHTNVTAVGGVLLSPLFTQPYAAKPGRRVELGLHFDF